MFRQRSGRARDVLGNCSEHLKNPDGRSGRAQAELGSEESPAARPRHHCRIRPAAQKGRVLRWEVKDSALTPSDGVSAGRSIVAPENPPTPISYRLVRASRSGPYSAVMTRTGGG